MTDKYFTLPAYPVATDIWDEIKSLGIPIAVYGMGNGADKLFDRLARYGICVSAVFASDGFVRGHSFRGYKVKTLSDVESELGDNFLILVCFASGRDEVVSLIKRIAGRHRLYIPDMPVAGEEYFDKDFYNANYSEIERAYSSLCDEESKKVFASIVNYKLSASADALFARVTDTDGIYGLLPHDIKVAVDAGAYNGDTCRELLSRRPSVESIYAIEPDARNYKKLVKYITEGGYENTVIPINAAAWSEDTLGSFSGSGNRNSSVDSTVSYQNRSESVGLIAIDGISKERVDYIKYDVEGAEMRALIGSRNTIAANMPALLVSVYHRSEDIFTVVNYLKDNYPSYSLYMRRTPCFPAWETALIAVLEKNCNL